MSENPWQPGESVKAGPTLVVGPQPPVQFRLVHIMLLVLVVAILCLFGLAFNLIGLAFLMGAMVGLVVLFQRRRTTRQDAVIWFLAIAADREMPLAPALVAFSDLCGGRFRRRIYILSEHLAMGTPLPDALLRVPKVFPRDAELLARVGWETGTLPGTLREAAATRTTRRPVWGEISSRIVYFLWVLGNIELIASFILYFVAPKFEAIFKDFGVPLPPVTIFVISASHGLIQFGWLFLLLVLLQAAVLIYWPFSFISWENYHMPVIDRLFLPRHTALVLRCLGWVAEGGKPLTWGFDLLARWYPTRWVSRRLERAAVDTLHGDEWTTALARQGLIRPADVALLDSARRVGNLPWALREVAESSERRLAYRLQIVAGMLLPLVVMTLGILVGLFAVAFFTPLTILIERLAG